MSGQASRTGQYAGIDLPERDPRIGEMVRVRTRRWLVEGVTPGATPRESSRVRLACADDDAQGQELEVFWRYELDRAILDDEPWSDLGERGFDPPDHFAAFLNTLRWNCTTATDPSLFQAPFRAGIKIEAYQMEPLRKALRLPRVNLFIADDTGLGKTIEAGLIIRELLLRKKVRTIVVAAPPSVLEQWKGEMEERFGLLFQVLDRAYLAKVRRDRGFGTNPWSTHSRFLVSHRLLADPTYAEPMRAWLGAMLPGSLLVLDEAHHAAPSHAGRYRIESKFTRAIRDLCGRFEHRLFLSATPHNGHSNSFSTLLELLDPHRFTRGVRVRGRSDLEAVMVRRLKDDIRREVGGFPVRHVEPVIIDGLPDDAPELVLSRLLDEYRSLRDRRFAKASARGRAAAGLLVVGLQQRLLSSIEAFAISLKRHRKTVERHWRERPGASRHAAELEKGPVGGFLSAPGSDAETGVAHDFGVEEPAALREDADAAEEAEEAEQIEAANREAEAQLDRDATAERIWREEPRLLGRMQAVAEGARTAPDAKTHRLIDWIRENMCPGLPPWGMPSVGPPPRWNDRRVLIFTENRRGTKRFLRRALEAAIEGTDRAGERIAVIDGLVGGPRRKEIQRRFNTPPGQDPLRILLATDAAREGLNFQAHCTDLFHFDLPWNPGRIEQRMAQRLLARFRAQGFVHHDLSRACLAHVADSVRRVVLIGRLSLYGERAERLHEEIVTVTARWIEPELRRGALQRYAADAERKTLALLEQVLDVGRASQPSETIRKRLLRSAARDIDELRPQLEPRAEELVVKAKKQLRDRGQREAEELRQTLVRQRERVRSELARHEAQAVQLALDLDAQDRRQMEANKRYWKRRLEHFDRDLEREPDRIRDFYRVRAHRVEPVGLVYLWPETG